MAVAAAILGLAEVALALSGVQAAYQVDLLGQWRMTPDLTDHEMRGAGDAHRFTLTTNPDGLRTHLAPGTSVDLALMGDSNVFGWGVDDHETLAARAGDALGVRALNAGQPGFSSTQVAWLFEHVVAAYRPKRVVVFQPMHDFNQALISDREYLEGGATWTDSARVFLARNSRIYAMTRGILFPYAGAGQLMPHIRGTEPRVARVSDDERARNYLSMQSLLAEWDGELWVGMLPFYRDLQSAPGGPVQHRMGSEWMLEFGPAAGVRVLDIRDCCGPGADSLVFPFDTGHLNVEGTRRAAAAIFEGLTTIR